MEQRTGTPQVQVFLCDGKSGLLLNNEYQSMFASADRAGNNFANQQEEIAHRTSDEKGTFRFEDVPEGTYRLVALKWTVPFKQLFDKQGTVVQLLGVANNIQVPRKAGREGLVVLTPPGSRIIEFNQNVGNNETLLVLSTKPPAFDPVLGFSSLGDEFLGNVVGIHRMLLGKSIVLNAPNSAVYGFLFAADNSPGFAHVTIEPANTKYVSVPDVQFVAGWSNGRKTPGQRIAKLISLLEEHELSVSELLEIPPLSNATFQDYKTRMSELQSKLHDEIEVTDSVKYRIGDLLAAQAYQRMKPKN